MAQRTFHDYGSVSTLFTAVDVLILALVLLQQPSAPAIPPHARSPDPVIEWVEPPPELPQLFRDSVRFGYLPVPQDHAEPDGPQIRIAIVLLPARGANPVPDPVVSIAGGPGRVRRAGQPPRPAALLLLAVVALIFVIGLAGALVVGMRRHFFIPAIGLPQEWAWLLAMPWLLLVLIDCLDHSEAPRRDQWVVLRARRHPTSRFRVSRLVNAHHGSVPS